MLKESTKSVIQKKSLNRLIRLPERLQEDERLQHLK